MNRLKFYLHAFSLKSQLAGSLPDVSPSAIWRAFPLFKAHNVHQSHICICHWKKYSHCSSQLGSDWVSLNQAAFAVAAAQWDTDQFMACFAVLAYVNSLVLVDVCRFGDVCPTCTFRSNVLAAYGFRTWASRVTCVMFRIWSTVLNLINFIFRLSLKGWMCWTFFDFLTVLLVLLKNIIKTASLQTIDGAFMSELRRDYAWPNRSASLLSKLLYFSF